MGSVVGCCAVLAGRDRGEPNENLEAWKETDHSDFAVDTASLQLGLEAYTTYGNPTVYFCKHSKLSAQGLSM